MNPRLRLLHFLVQPVLGIDDGSDGGVPPAPQQPQPQPLSLEQMRELLDNWPRNFEALKAQYEQAPSPSPPVLDGNRAQRRSSARKSRAKPRAKPRG